MASAVLDASAVLALLKGEPGTAEVKRHVPGAAISAVNLAEVVAKLSEAGMSRSAVGSTLATLGAEILPCDEARAISIGMLRAQTRDRGLSLGDRACLALAQELSLPALTADQAWTQLDLGVAVQLIRDREPR